MTDDREVGEAGRQRVQAFGRCEPCKEGLHGKRGRHDQRSGGAAAQKGHEPHHQNLPS
jgi:hypothetical protein